MDFTRPYTEEQQQFRQQVRSWLEEHIQEDMKDPIDRREFTNEHFQYWKEKLREIAEQGWLYPTYPKEYGGGGLTGEHETVITEELRRAGVPMDIGFTAPFVLPALLVWGTEEQKEMFLKPLLSGKEIAWQKFTEPQSGSDLANYQSKAVRDGDDWLLTGQNVFVSGYGRPNWLYGPMVTDPEAPRHRNLGYFMIPYPSPGLEIVEQNLLNGGEQHFIFLDNVRVPGTHLIGGDHQGWQVANTSLEQEHGGRGEAFPSDESVNNLLKYAQNTTQAGSSMGKDPIVQQTAMQAYLEAQISSLLAQRTFWMYQNHMEITYEGNEASVHSREYTPRNATRIRDIMGLYALLGAREPGVPFRGQQEVDQRLRAGQNHAGGSTNIAKVVLARRIGISRTKERPAPTPSTATSHGS